MTSWFVAFGTNMRPGWSRSGGLVWSHCAIGGSRCSGQYSRRVLSLHRHSTLTLTLYPTPALSGCRSLHVTAASAEKERHRPSSKVEESVLSLREKFKEKPPQTAPSSQPDSASIAGETTAPEATDRRSLWERFLDELRHYYHGSKLLVINVNVSRKLVGRLLRGDTLTRREHRQLVRTTADLFRVVPFSVFVIIPFMELLLPVFIKLFPNMLPSTFQTANEQEAKIKQKLKIKLETAKFLQRTLDSMALKGKGHYSESARDFAEFFKQIRSSGEQASNEQILRFSKFFEDELTLDSLGRAELVALCHVLEIQTFGTNNILRFLIQLKLRRLAADDLVIHREGIDSLTVPELQHAVRSRGMRSYGVSEHRLRSQLEQWIDLSLNEKVPPSLLLLSRALYLPENLPAEDQLKATISRLPESLATSARAAIGDREGRVDFKTRVDLVQEEERRIKEEREERDKLQRAAPASDSAVSPPASASAVEYPDIAVDMSADKVAEPLADNAAVIIGGVSETVRAEPAKDTDVARKEDQAVLTSDGLTSHDLSAIEDAIEHIATDKHRALLEREEIDDIKEELADYKEDLDDLQNVVDGAGRDAVQLRETKAAQRLFKGVNKLIGSMDAMIEKLQEKRQRIIAENGVQTSSDPAVKDVDSAADSRTVHSDEEVAIVEVIQSLRNIQGLSDHTKLNLVADVLAKIDYNQDGSVRVEDVYEVIDAISEDNVKLSSGQLKEIIELLDREKVLELERRIEKALSKETTLSQSVPVSAAEETLHQARPASSSSSSSSSLPSSQKSATNSSSH